MCVVYVMRGVEWLGCEDDKLCEDTDIRALIEGRGRKGKEEALSSNESWLCARLALTSRGKLSDFVVRFLVAGFKGSPLRCPRGIHSVSDLTLRDVAMHNGCCTYTYTDGSHKLPSLNQNTDNSHELPSLETKYR